MGRKRAVRVEKGGCKRAAGGREGGGDVGWEGEKGMRATHVVKI